ncbi:hypothetical protein DFH08DRAFT_968356 [Mycena albidolilacea]|uniref:Uncharacterized protein n=1 Tax=Mycena albidolilacea TaxID=1033008 RepID=A0AAD7EI08_9AGAR|nr:hypothetical protein DFH08DRAFT_968356 [Mycena albidolilacea]
MTANRVVTNLSATQASSDPAPEVLLTPAEAKKILRTLSPDKIDAIARASTGFATKDGLITDQTPASIMSKTNVVFAANKSWSLAIDGKPLEYIVTLSPRSTWAFNNGPGGNFAVIGWKAGDRLVKAIKVEPRPGQTSDSVWVKTTRKKKDITCEWRVQIFDSSFLYPRLAEYAISGRPVSWDTAVDVHTALDKRFEMFASTLEDVVKKKNTSGPSSSMFLAPRRPIFVPNATTMDEGRFSEYDDIYGLLPLISNPDIRFNRVPEVLVFNSTTKEYLPMSFHLLHRLGTGVVLNATIAPMAYEHGRKLGWEYRLINITVVGHREDDALSSPSKYVVKRKAIMIDLDDSLDERPDPKKTAGGSKAGGDKTAPEGSSKV